MSARLQIDAAALGSNYQLFRDAARPGTAGAVVKADGYGLGAATVAQVLWRQGCRDYFVATAEEGASLRQALQDAADARIFVFEGALQDSARLLLDAALIPVLNHAGQAATWRRFGGAGAAVHVDTGMYRLGFPWTLERADLRGLQVELLVTHLACADEPEHPLNALQLERLGRARALLPGVPVSIGNSAAVLGGADLAGDLGRPGIGLYGGNPYLSAPSPVRPVATLEAPILQLRQVPAGESVGYGATNSARTERQVAVVGAGYADGIPRLLSNRGQVMVAGRRCPIVGRVSMDLTTVDVTGLGAAVGDWVEFFGAGIAVDEVAAWAETIAYEVLTGLGRRPLRCWTAL